MSHPQSDPGHNNVQQKWRIMALRSVVVSLLFVSREILKHEELEGKIKMACLGSLLQRDHLERLENQYLTHKEVKNRRLSASLE